MELIPTILIAVIGSSGVWGFLQIIYKTKVETKKYNLEKLSNDIKELCESHNRLCKAQKETMQDRICWLAQSYVNKGEISLTDRANLKAQYDAYCGLGTPCAEATESIEAIEQLPLKKKEKK